MTAPAGTPGYHPGEHLFILTTLMALPGPETGGSVMIPRVDEQVFPWLRLPPAQQLLERLREGQELYFWIYVKKRPKVPVAFMRIICEDKDHRKAQLSFNFLGKGWKKDDEVAVLELEAWTGTVRILLRHMGFETLVTGVLDPDDPVAANLKTIGFQRNQEDNFLEVAQDVLDQSVLAQPAVAARLVERDGRRFLRIAVFELTLAQFEAVPANHGTGTTPAA